MSYGLLIRCDFLDDKGQYYCVDIKKRGYIGTSYNRELTGEAVTISYGDGNSASLPFLLGTMVSFGFYAEDGDNWSQLYTADAYQFRVEVMKMDHAPELNEDVTGDIVFCGHLAQQEYSEDLTWQSVISVKSYCGLGRLKDMLYVDAAGENYTGVLRVSEIIADILGKLSLDLHFFTAIDWHDAGMVTGDSLHNMSLDVRLFGGKDCSEVLTQLLPNCRVMQRGGAFYIESYTALLNNYATWEYDSDGTVISLSSAAVDLSGNIDQNTIWLEGTPTLLRWPGLDRLVIEQDYGKRLSFLKNHKIDGIGNWTLSSGVLTGVWEEESGSYIYMKGLNTGAEGVGLSQSVAVDKFNYNSGFLFRVNIAPIGFRRLGINSTRASRQPLLVNIALKVTLKDSLGVAIGWLTKDGWVQREEYIYEDEIESTISGDLNWHELKIETSDPTATLTGENFVLTVDLFQAIDQVLWAAGSGGSGTYAGVAFSDVILLETGEFGKGQNITCLNENEFIDNSDLKFIVGTLPDKLNAPNIWAGGISASGDEYSRAAAWSVAGMSTGTGWAELAGTLIMSGRRRATVVMRARAIGVEKEKVYQELNQPGVNYVFVEGELNLRTNTLDGQWAELLTFDNGICTISVTNLGGNGVLSTRRVTFINNELNSTYTNITGSPTDNSALVEYIAYINGIKVPDTRTTLISGAIVWVSGLTYQSTTLVYKINGVDYKISPQRVTINAADALLPRLDIFYVDSSSVIGYRAGVPAVNPVKPTVGPDELEITQVYVAAGAIMPTIVTDVIYDEAVEWSLASSTDDHITINFQATNAPYTGSKCINISIAIPETVAATPSHKVGDKYQGGVIFYLERGISAGYIAAEFPSSEGVGYSDTHTTSANATIVSSGIPNTVRLMSIDIGQTYAAMYCDNYANDGYEDWFLGSKAEMEQLIFRKSFFPGLTGAFWTSSEITGTYDWKRAYCVEFSNGVTYIRDKTNRFKVVPIRHFDDADIPTGVAVTEFTPVSTLLTFQAPEIINISNGIFTAQLRTSVDWLPNTTLIFVLWQDAAIVGRLIMSKQIILHGFNAARDDWQMIAVPVSLFNLTQKTINKLTISLTGGWPNNATLSIDKVQIQHDSNQVFDWITAGTYGGPMKALSLTVDSNGKTTYVEEAFHIAERLTPLPDGVVVTFETPEAYKPLTPVVYACGVKQMINIDYTETGGKIVFLVTPETGEILTCDYYTL